MTARHASMNPISVEAIPATGLTVVFDPGESARLDIVFVHGFTGHPVRTWTHKKGNAQSLGANGDENTLEPPSKIRKVNHLWTSRQGRVDLAAPVLTPLYWPRDLLPTTIPYARILTYGYDTNLRHKLGGPPLNKTTVYGIAWDFLVDLEAERRAHPARPILFIAHSLGGIVVKEMLRRAGGCQVRDSRLYNVFNSTTGVVFFGTPHGGADPRGILQHAVEKLAKALGISVNEQIVQSLLPTSERLKELRDEFGPMASERNWRVHSFQEGLGITLLSGRKVVEDASSCLSIPPETTQHIHKNHMDMCRFTGPDDMEYKKVVAALERMTEAIAENPIAADADPLNEDQRKQLMEALKFDHMDSRQLSIKEAHAETCKWLLKRPEYLDWLSEDQKHRHHGFLWIKGKPGAGKSTLMNFALANSRKTMKGRTIISFFFNARGSSLEKSTAGIYLGLATGNICNDFVQSVEALKRLFEKAVRLLEEASVVCLIDALDECDEDQVRDMVAFFQRLGESAVSSGVRLHVLFSSRHYPYISIERGLELELEKQAGHGQDITSYISKELKIGHSSTSEQIRLDLYDKAGGVFMWVFLVVGILNKEYDHGRRGAQLRRKLAEIPGDLHELFRNLLTRDCHRRDELQSCIRPEELYFAIISDTEPEDINQWDHEEVSMDAIQRLILSSSKGLAETTRSKIPVVQFIHESVRDFLLKEKGLEAVWPDLGSNFEGESHGRLAQCCIQYINAPAVKNFDTAFGPEDTAEHVDALREKSKKAFPFLQYSVQNVLYHAEKAEAGRVSQQTLIHHFPRAHWLELYNMFEEHKVRRHSTEATFLYVLAELGMPALIRTLPYNQCCFDPEDGRYGPPIFAAVALRNFGAVIALLDVHLGVQLPVHMLHTPGQWSEKVSTSSVLSRSFKFSRRVGVLVHAARSRIEPLLDAYLLTPSGKMEVQDPGIAGKALSYVVEHGDEPAVRLLLATGKADIESKDELGRTPLSRAAQNGHVAVVKLLLATGKADIDSKDFAGQTPLSRAAQYGRQVNINSTDLDGITALEYARRYGHTSIVQILEQAKVGVDNWG
ncbi:hypothetical protein QBC47DRAFT_464378 [Echria macrotheca]|uniref:Nephrocystin 3-like N-terminal domain-containing protein n=1 Tax=Echria macrotheca TaxID=438768 RepID=A0AAJ0F5B4_9PEZI|nr:hypothetical protein QBC47DRAFT_464378 [Echria macrotheca]